MNRVRRVIFLLFLMAYLVLCPLLILYAFGTIFDPATQEMTKTGLLYLSSAPDGADIYLEKSRYRDQTPASISGLMPGSYKVTLRAKGYKPWVHTVTVSAGKATAFDNILLVPKSWPVRHLMPGPFVKCVPLRGTEYFLLNSTSRLGGILVYDPQRSEAAPLVGVGSPLFDFSVDTVFTREGSSALVITGGFLWNRKYLYVPNAARRPPEILDISKLFPERPLDIDWSDAKRGKLIAVYGDHLDLVDAESMSLYPRYAEDIKGYGAQDKWIYALDTDNNLFRIPYERGQKELLFGSYEFGNTLFGPSGFFKIHPLKGVILFLGPKGQLLANLPPYGLVEKGIAGLVRFRKIPRVIYWTRDTVGMVDFSQRSGEEFFLIKGSVRHQLLYQAGRNITDCWLVNEGTHLLFNDDNRLYLLEIEPQGDPHVEYICDVKEKTSFFYSEDAGCVYYLEPPAGRLNSIQLFPK